MLSVLLITLGTSLCYVAASFLAAVHLFYYVGATIMEESGVQRESYWEAVMVGIGASMGFNVDVQRAASSTSTPMELNLQRDGSYGFSKEGINH